LKDGVRILGAMAEGKVDTSRQHLLNLIHTSRMETEEIYQDRKFVLLTKAIHKFSF